MIDKKFMLKCFEEWLKMQDVKSVIVMITNKDYFQCEVIKEDY